MKRYFLPLSFFTLLFVGFSLIVSGFSHAQENFKIAPMPDQPTQYGGSSFGQNHSYSVLFRGNGEAVVGLKVNFTNYDSQPVYTLRYKLPANIGIRNVFVYQVDATPTKSPCYYPMDSYSPTPTPAIEQSGESGAMPSLIAPCQYDSYMYSNTYKRADFQVEGENVTVTLPVPVYMNQTGNFFITFRTMSFVKKNVFGTFMYNVETLKTGEPITSIQVGVSTEHDFVIRDNKGQVNYQKMAISSALPTLDSSGTVRSTELDTYYNMIGQGAIYKYASSLAPNESFTVKGSYADSTWKLYIKEILITLLLLEILGVIVVVGAMKILRLVKSAQASSEKNNALAALSSQQKNGLLTAGGSFAVSLCIVGYTIVFFFFTAFFQSRFYYTEFGTILFILTLLISLAMYVVLFFGFVIFVSVRKGIGWGVAAFLMQIGWLILFTIVSFVILFAFRFSFYGPVPALGVREFSTSAVPVEKSL